MKKIYILLLVLTLSLLFNQNVMAEQLKTDVKIITKLESGGFMTPALSENMTFVYNRFEFHLYSNQNNTNYNIIVDNITISDQTIKGFKTVFYWNTTKDYITLLEVNIGTNKYLYSNIFVFDYSIMNTTILDEGGDEITFTKSEFDNYINELKIKLFTADNLGWMIAVILSFIGVREIKKSVIEEI